MAMKKSSFPLHFLQFFTLFFIPPSPSSTLSSTTITIEYYDIHHFDNRSNVLVTPLLT